MTLAWALLAATPRAERLPVSPHLMSRQWPASWIAVPGAPERDAGVYHFRRFLSLQEVPARLLVHASADQRYVLHVNGRRVGVGPGRGDPEHWRFETYDLAPFLKPGENLVAATVCALKRRTMLTTVVIGAATYVAALVLMSPGLLGR